MKPGNRQPREGGRTVLILAKASCFREMREANRKNEDLSASERSFSFHFVFGIFSRQE